MEIKNHLKEIEKTIGYTFKDKSLLIQAFTRTSYCNEKNYGGKNNYQSNEVLEFIGDSALSTAIVTLLLDDKTKRYAHGITTELKEGDFSNIRSKLSDKSNLSKSTERLGLQKFLLLGEGDAKLGIANEPSVMEDLFESIIGAIYIDSASDLTAVIGSVKKMLDTGIYLSEEKPENLRSAKGALQEFCADKKRRLPAPLYKTIGESGPDHRKEYERACYIGERLIATGKGKNLKIADASAAEAALKILEKEEKKEPSHDPDAPARLKALCLSSKATSPEWRDLGEKESEDGLVITEIECRALGKCATGKGETKTEARARAAESILALIEEEKKKAEKSKPTPAPKQKKAKKKAEAKVEQKTAPTFKENKKKEKAKSSPSPKKRPLSHTKRS